MFFLGEGGGERGRERGRTGKGKTCPLPASGTEVPGEGSGAVSRGGARAGLLLCQEILSSFDGRDIIL